MNAREFAAAHDRWLEPPEDAPEDDGDPDHRHDRQRQLQLEIEEYQAEVLRQRQECEE